MSGKVWEPKVKCPLLPGSWNWALLGRFWSTAMKTTFEVGSQQYFKTHFRLQLKARSFF